LYLVAHVNFLLNEYDDDDEQSKNHNSTNLDTSFYFSKSIHNRHYFLNTTENTVNVHCATGFAETCILLQALYELLSLYYSKP